MSLLNTLVLICTRHDNAIPKSPNTNVQLFHLRGSGVMAPSHPIQWGTLNNVLQKGSRHDSTGTSTTGASKTMFLAPLGGETKWLPELQSRKLLHVEGTLNEFGSVRNHA